MDNVVPFFTKDGSVGLYSKSDEDIYHSVYGALAEAYDKFILPVDFDNLLKNNNSINVLDICYGIGYNSKSFLNLFLKKFICIKNKNIFSHAIYNDTIDTNNILSSSYTKSIHTYNIFYNIFNKNAKKNNKSVTYKFLDKDFGEDNINFVEQTRLCKSNKLRNCNNLSIKVNIDAIDTNKELMLLSPFFITKNNINKLDKTNIEKIDKHLNSFRRLKHTYSLSEDVNYILIKSLIDEFGIEELDKTYQKFITDPLNRKFIDNHSVKFMQSYQNNGYKLYPCKNKLTFLHNIYYRYLSYRYKNRLNRLEKLPISLKYHTNDARQFAESADKKYDIIFLDAFTPSKCPSLWTYEFFKNLYSILSDDGVVLTYSNSAAVRNAFMQNNFYVGKIFNPNENKFSGTVASKNKNIIVYALDDRELGLLKTKAGIVYRDKSGSDIDSDIIKNREIDLMNSKLVSATQYLKEIKE